MLSAGSFGAFAKTMQDLFALCREGSRRNFDKDLDIMFKFSKFICLCVATTRLKNYT